MQWLMAFFHAVLAQAWVCFWARARRSLERRANPGAHQLTPCHTFGKNETPELLLEGSDPPKKSAQHEHQWLGPLGSF